MPPVTAALLFLCAAVAQARPGSGRELQQAPWELTPGTQTYLPLKSNDTVSTNRVMDNRIPVVDQAGNLGFLGEASLVDSNPDGERLGVLCYYLCIEVLSAVAALLSVRQVCHTISNCFVCQRAAYLLNFSTLSIVFNKGVLVC